GVDDESAALGIGATNSVTEQGGAQNIGVTLTITGSGSGTFALGTGIVLTADVTDAGGGSATSGTDYSAVGTQTVTFSSGAASGTVQNIALTPINDRLLEGNETVHLHLGNLGNPASVSASLGNTSNTTTITDDESATLSIAATSSVTEGNNGPQTAGTVTLTITGSGSGTFALGKGIILTADVSDTLTGNATSGTDYSPFSTHTLTFDGGTTDGTLQTGVTQSSIQNVLDDLADDNAEKVNLALTVTGTSGTATTAGNAANQTTIIDNDTAIARVFNLSVAGSYTVIRNGGNIEIHQGTAAGPLLTSEPFSDSYSVTIN